MIHTRYESFDQKISLTKIMIIKMINITKTFKITGIALVIASSLSACNQASVKQSDENKVTKTK